MSTTTDVLHKHLVKQYHTLCTRLGKTKNDKIAILDSYGVESSKDLSINELYEVCRILEKELNPNVAELDKWRKRVLGVIGAYQRDVNKPDDLDYIKGMACRAAGSKRFNQIPKSRLIGIYNEFNNQRAGMQGARMVAYNQIEKTKSWN